MHSSDASTVAPSYLAEENSGSPPPNPVPARLSLQEATSHVVQQDSAVLSARHTVASVGQRVFADSVPKAESRSQADVTVPQGKSLSQPQGRSNKAGLECNPKRSPPGNSNACKHTGSADHATVHDLNTSAKRAKTQASAPDGSLCKSPSPGKAQQEEKGCHGVARNPDGGPPLAAHQSTGDLVAKSTRRGALKATNTALTRQKKTRKEQRQNGAKEKPQKKRKAQSVGTQKKVRRRSSRYRLGSTADPSWSDPKPTVCIPSGDALLPPVKVLVDGIVRPPETNPDTWSLQRIEKPASGCKPLPSMKEFCQPAACMPFDRLESAARGRERRKCLQSPVRSLQPGRASEALVELEISPFPSQIPGTVRVLTTQNERLAKEILVLRQELVIAYGNQSAQPSRIHLNSPPQSREEQTQQSQMLPSRIHTAITLGHLAAQVASFGLTSIPRDWVSISSPNANPNPFISCASDALVFVQKQMTQRITHRSVDLVCSMFSKVLLQLTEDILKKYNAADGLAHPSLKEFIAFLCSEIEVIFSAFLMGYTTMDMDWNRVFCERLVQPLSSVLSSKPTFSNDVEKLVCNALKKAAELVREGERDNPKVSVTSICHSLELSMTLAVVFPRTVLMLPTDDFYAIARHSKMFADHVLFLRIHPEKKTSGDCN